MLIMIVYFVFCSLVVEMHSNIGWCPRRHSTFRSTIYRRYSRRDIRRGAGCRRGRITTVGIGRNKRSFSRLGRELHPARVPPFPSFFTPFPTYPFARTGIGFDGTRKSSATSREISRWMLKVPRNKSGSQCSGTTTMTNRRVRQVLPLLTIREGRSPRVLSVREINSLRNSRANFSSRRAKRFADIYTREYLSAR